MLAVTQEATVEAACTEKQKNPELIRSAVIAILRMVQRFPRMRLATESAEWAPNYGFRGLKALPVTL